MPIMSPPLFDPNVPQAFLPREYILGIKRALDEKRRLYEELPVQIEDLAKRFEAAMIFAPPGFDPDSAVLTISESNGPEQEVLSLGNSDEPPTSTISLDDLERGKIGWRKAILIILHKDSGGVAHKDVLQRARELYNLPASQGEKGFYNAVAKLITAGQVVKYGNRLYSRESIDSLKSSGSLPDIPEVRRRAGSSAEFVVKTLRDNPNGLTGPQLREALSKIPDAPKSLSLHGQYIYNILAPMIGAGEVVKSDAGVYRLKAIANDDL